MTKDVKRVSYNTSNSYETMFENNNTTKSIWLVFHGIGYLSKYFLKYFENLNPLENYVIAPQAPSKYYLKNEYKYVGASWLTKIDTKDELQNNFAYLDAVVENEGIINSKNLVLFGFSQGVSILTRWMAMRQIQPKNIILYAGGIPNELTKENFEYLNFEDTKVTFIYGNSDFFLTEKRLETEKKKIESLFQNKAEILSFEGGHEMKPNLIAELVSNK
ncbi:esterase [Muricauda sp. DJ-13]|uniref:Esterase n=1 Tax=Croceivirga thetidis TaxID=2721623 RepID=A0ABX1GQ95_9FLAO|nr:esterase [Croceivirga thetidis]NKI32098.1 esterase [Croceivirga thetidis]